MTLLQKNLWIRTIYLYLFALVGLVLVVIGAVRLLDLGLKIYIFKEADKLDTVQPAPPYPPYGIVEPVRAPKEPSPGDLQISEKTQKLSQEEKDALLRWLADYKNWQETQAKIDYLKARRQREASNSLAFIIVGVPLYLYHWSVIKRDRKKEEQSSL